jgi:hypothetical protein
MRRLDLAVLLLLGSILVPSLAGAPLIHSAWADDDGGDGGGGDDGGGDDHSGSGGGDDDSSGPGDDGGGDDDGGDDDGGDDDGMDDDSADDGSGGADRGRDDVVPGEVVVINEDVSFLDTVRALGFRVIAQQPLGALGLTVTRLGLPATLTPRTAQALLQERFPDLLVDSNGLYRPQAALSLPPVDYPERLIGWQRPPAACGRKVTLGLVDTGLDTGHPALAGRLIERRSFLAAGEAPASTGHGTAVAAILVGTGGGGLPPGLLPDARLRVAEAFLADVDGAPVASVVGVAAALDWLVETDTPVVNLSLAGADNLLLAIAVKRASARGTVLVAAAGNDGPGAAPAFPAAYPEVLAVAAVGADLEPYAEGTQGDYIDLAAPGVSVATAGPEGLALVSGSSFAAPYVAAAAALRTVSGVAAGPAAVRQALVAAARDLGAPGPDPVFGWGLLQAARCNGES